MGYFDLFHEPDINHGLSQAKNVSNAILLDVRTPQEFCRGHIPGSKNVPLHAIGKIARIAENKDVPLFVYCHSGVRSALAIGMLEHMGYSMAVNIGGINAYKGDIAHCV